jgi:hypothetical protein
MKDWTYSLGPNVHKTPPALDGPCRGMQALIAQPLNVGDVYELPVLGTDDQRARYVVTEQGMRWVPEP